MNKQSTAGRVPFILCWLEFWRDYSSNCNRDRSVLDPLSPLSLREAQILPVFGKQTTRTTIVNFWHPFTTKIAREFEQTLMNRSILSRLASVFWQQFYFTRRKLR